MTTFWAPALLVTLAIEVPLVAALYPRDRARMAAVALFANATTNLLLNVALPHLVREGPRILVGEIVALIVEAVAYGYASRPKDWARAIFASGLGNALSFAAGLLLWP